MFVCIVILVIMVQGIQYIGTKGSILCDHRIR